MRRAAPPRCSRALAATVSVAAVLLLSACSAGPVTPVDTSTSTATAPPTATPAPTATPTAAPVVLLPEGTAGDNLPYFQGIVDAVASGPDSASGRAYIDALTAGGFDKAAMQVTADETTIGQAAESIQFSVAWRDACLVGQVGPATGAPVATVLPLLAGGRCLVGQTRTIDW